MFCGFGYTRYMQLQLFEEPNQQENDDPTIRGPKRIRKLSYLHPGIPRLVIEGQWMKKLGLAVGDEVRLEYYEDKIVIIF